MLHKYEFKCVNTKKKGIDKDAKCTLITKESGPTRLAIALPRFTAVSIFAARIRKTLIAIVTPPTNATPYFIDQNEI